ncbi:hypothetical protein LCGC14_2826850, partial [marine sediment metagenome]
IEDRFNNSVVIPDIKPPTEPVFDPVEPPFPSQFEGLNFEQTFKDFSFVLGYPSRLLRSVLALSTLTAQAERFGDVRKSQGFWAAMGEVVKVEDINVERITAITERTAELAKKVPGLLTDPEVPENAIPSIGRLITGPFPELKPGEWVLNLIGELLIEFKVAKAIKTVAKKGMAKLLIVLF